MNLFSTLVGATLLFAGKTNGNAGLFTYYETPLDGVLGTFQGRGPSNWRRLVLPNNANQCGGFGQSTGFGQSPIAIPTANKEVCDTDMSRYVFQAGNCGWTDLNFTVVPNGVLVGPMINAECTMARMKIPGQDNFYEALQFHIHTGSEHSVDGQYYPNELHVVHRESNGESFAVFGTFIDYIRTPYNSTQEEGAEHAFFEYFLQGWEARARQTEEYCARRPSGSGIFVPNSVLKSHQAKITCDAIADGINPEAVDWDYDHDIPFLNQVAYPDGLVPSIYDILPTTDEFGIYSYRGGLTTPPCTEIVHWNLLDTPMLISKSQLDRLYKLILCFVEISSCQHATIADERGLTSRPPQELFGRKIIHRCPDGPNVVMDVPIPPPAPSFARPRRFNPHFAILFPWFVMALGVAVYFLLSRYVHVLPYTAVMFLLGTCMGIGLAGLEKTDQLSTSLRMWENINSEVLLITFLPGLLFKDAYGLNVHLFRQSINQCLILAFPMVLAGTTLLGVFAYFAFPYEWSFALSMTFGSILSATDPVAVSALLNEVGAPPRLKMHISGESLLNDGSAIVFFTIFSAQFLFENQIPNVTFPNLGEIDVVTGILLFLRMSLGAVAVGIASGLSLIFVLRALYRRFSLEESIVQVTATITAAYLTYYVAEPVCRTSGVMAVVTCGVVTKAFGSAVINSPLLMERFWDMVEHLLNTVIFCLGGLVWGTVVSNMDDTRAETFSGKDWGYLFLTYIVMMVARFLLIYQFFPIIKKIGLKSNWKEAVFISWGGLRGAVGIALAIALDNELVRDTLPGDPRRNFTSQLFGLTGGVAFLTLIINGTTCGPLLKALGLTDSTDAHQEVVHGYRRNLVSKILDRMIMLLGDPRFCDVDFAIVREHVSFLKGLTADDLLLAVKRNKEGTPAYLYRVPNLYSIRPFLSPDAAAEIVSASMLPFKTRFRALVALAQMSSADALGNDATGEGEVNEAKLIELRKLFLGLLRGAYEDLIDSGELNSREGLVVFILNESLEIASDAVANGLELCDFVVVMKSRKGLNLKRRLGASAHKPGIMIDETKMSDSSNVPFGDTETKNSSGTVKQPQKSSSKHKADFKKIKIQVHQTIAFIKAHEMAQERFKTDFCGGRAIPPTARTVLDESYREVAAAESFLASQNKDMLQTIVSHMMCSILLNNAATYVAKLIDEKLLLPQEGEEYLEEIEHDLSDVDRCASRDRCERKGTGRSTALIDDSSRRRNVKSIPDFPDGKAKTPTNKLEGSPIEDSLGEDPPIKDPPIEDSLIFETASSFDDEGGIVA